MSDKLNNPRAFPKPADPCPAQGHRQGGMTLLDYFAGQALASEPDPDGSWQNDARAHWCYDMAEEMLKERERRMNDDN